MTDRDQRPGGVTPLQPIWGLGIIVLVGLAVDAGYGKGAPFWAFMAAGMLVPIFRGLVTGRMVPFATSRVSPRFWVNTVWNYGLFAIFAFLAAYHYRGG